jgi:hypothetical protein
MAFFMAAGANYFARFAVLSCRSLQNKPKERPRLNHDAPKQHKR